MFCADYNSRRLNLQTGCQLLAFALHLLHFYRKLREKYRIWISSGRQQFKHIKHIQ